MNNRQLFENLGFVQWLWMNSILHRDWSVQSLAHWVLPAIRLDQYRVVVRDGFPVAYCSWAFLTPECERKFLLMRNFRLKPEDWNAGDRMWFIDWVAPFSAKDSFELKNIVAGQFPTSFARAVRVKPPSAKGRVMEFKGRALSVEQARALSVQYYEELCGLAKNLGQQGHRVAE